jgi:cholera toxin transcriptional activator
MPTPDPTRRFRFGTYEADAVTGELRRQGLRIKLSAQPFQLLLLLLESPGRLFTREEISAQLWPGDTFVDFDHGLNSAINRIREALQDSAANPRFVETLARRGYRFIAPVERIDPSATIGPAGGIAPAVGIALMANAELPNPAPAAAEAITPPLSRFLATPADLPQTSYAVVRNLFVLLQLMYIGFYVGALANLAEIQDLLSALLHAEAIFLTLIISAAILIAARAFLISAVLFHAPRLRQKYLHAWPFFLVADVLWSLAPFLLLHHMSAGLAIACVPLLVYSPFAQRSLILMGAGTPPLPAHRSAL